MKDYSAMALERINTGLNEILEELESVSSSALSDIPDNYKCHLICNRKKFSELKNKFNMIRNKEQIQGYETVKDSIAIIEGEMNCIVNNSVEENVEIVLKNKIIYNSNLFVHSQIVDIFTKEEMKSFIDNKLSARKISHTDEYELYNICFAAHEYSIPFEKNKIRSISKRICKEIEKAISIQSSLRVLDVIESSRMSTKSKSYLPDEVRNAVQERLNALEVLYQIK